MALDLARGPRKVIVIPDGFLWQGQSYASLSTVAKAITGTSWNGWVFFGAKRQPKKPKVDRKPSTAPANTEATAHA